MMNLSTPHSGHVKLRLRANKYHPSTIVTHVNDLFQILNEEGKPACMISDGGPDYSLSNVANSLL